MLRPLGLAILLSASGARAAVISERPDKVAVTIYHEGQVDTAELSQRDSHDRGFGGLALITETRSIDLPAGESEIQFRGVADTMVPQTADIGGLPEETVERNFDYDLLSPRALLAKSVGQTVHLVRTDRRTGKAVEQTARVHSGPDGAILEIDGKFEALHCSGLPERLVFDRVPEGLIDTPTLTVRTDAARAGHYVVTLRYIAAGLNWSADYVARIGADDRTLALTGWITLANFADTGFANAPVDVIAGHVETSGDDEAPKPQAIPYDDACWPVDIDWARARVLKDMLGFAAARAAPAPPPAMAPDLQTVTVSATRREIEARNFGDYKQYPLPEPTTVAARQTKQVLFLDRKSVPFDRVYSYRMSLRPRMETNAILLASVLLRLHNTSEGGLGMALPAGGISAMAVAADGNPFLAGQDKLGDVAVGMPLEIAIGQTTAVRAQVRVTGTATGEHGGATHSRNTLEVTMTNDKAVPVTLEWRQAMDQPGASLVSASRPHGTRNGDLLWAVSLKAGEQAMLRYTLDVP